MPVKVQLSFLLSCFQFKAAEKYVISVQLYVVLEQVTGNTANDSTATDDSTGDNC
jgi:hypothetical protein